MVSWPLRRIGEAYIDGQWVELPLRESTAVTITRGINAEGSTARPGSMKVRVNDPDGIYSPRSAESDLYGVFGRGTAVRFRVGDVPATPAPDLADDFDRTESNGWGTSTSGATWAIWNLTSPPPSEFSVSGGAGRITTSTYTSDRLITTDGLDLSDFEATFTIATDTLPQSNTTEKGIRLSALARCDPAAVALYLFDVRLLPNTGLPDNRGLGVTVNITTPSGNPSTPVYQVPELTYAVDTPLRVRIRCEGPELRMRVWTDGTAEPDHWHAQMYDETYTSGEFGFRAAIEGTSTPTPVEVAFADLELRPLTPAADAVRLHGEVAAADPYEDEHGPASAYTDLDVAGSLRRYDGKQKPILSAMRRRIAGYGPVAYWAMEEGAQGDAYIAQTGADSTAAPLTVSGVDFARDSTLVGSAPLPTVRAGATLQVSNIPGEDTGYWAVWLMLKITTDQFPTDNAVHQILRFTTGTATLTLSAWLSSSTGKHWLLLKATDADGSSLGADIGIDQESLVAGGNLGFLDRWQQVKIYAEPGSFKIACLDPDDTGRVDTMSVSVDAGRVTAINTVIGPGLAGIGLGHLSVWGVPFVAAYTYARASAGHLLSSELGIPGLTTRQHLALLATDEALPLDVYGPAELPLGPYAQASAISLVQAAASTEMGLLVEHRDQLGLKYVSRQSLYEQDVDLVLDYASGMVFSPFRPRDDDKGLHNRITVRRRQGSSYTGEVTDGPLSVQPPPDGIGVKDTSVETVVYTDDQLADQAGWRLHLATWDQMRVASITLKMANPRLHQLLDTVLGLREGSRIQVINTPRRYGPDGFDLLVVGSKETHAEAVADFTFTCVPYGPYKVAGAVVHEGFEDADLDVDATDGGDLPWARSQLHYNSGTWSLRSGAITNNQTSDWALSVPSWATELRFFYWTSSEPAGPGFLGDRLEVYVDGTEVLRAQGTTPWTQHIVDVAGASTVTFTYRKDNSASSGEDAAHIDDLVLLDAAPAKTDTDGSELAAAVDESATSLTVEITDGPLWPTTATYPAEFPFDAVLGGERVTVTGITGSTSPQTWTVVRSVNGVVKPHAASTAVHVADRAPVAL
ncbi:hypothetical protein [Streptomyces sp. bgisy154]|uniref:hypothetical protein n=1 Tax=Streptomyces sp. bgisy154 TaxID=3413794 RepID=UPI003D738C99